MEKVVVGISGGVDSAVTAVLLKEKGYEVTGAFVKMHDFDEEEEARNLADFLEIPFVSLDYREVFREKVVLPFMKTYAKGETPNPCILCNPAVKLKALSDYAKKNGADYIATGHYAHVLENNGFFTLGVSDYAEKDQTYVLYRLPQEMLKMLILPLGDYEKSEVRKIAEEKRLPVARKKDSLEICFIPDNDHDRFLKENLPENTFLPGNFIDEKGRIIGSHQGIGRFTIGQRKGLGVAMGEPVYVTKINSQTREVTLGNNDSLFTEKVVAGDVVWMGEKRSGKAFGKIRYGQKLTPCEFFFENGELTVTFDTPVRAVTPGQSIVLYEDKKILCGGFIR